VHNSDTDKDYDIIVVYNFTKFLISLTLEEKSYSIKPNYFLKLKRGNSKFKSIFAKQKIKALDIEDDVLADLYSLKKLLIRRYIVRQIVV